MQRIEAVISDLDDTLLTPEHLLTERTLRTLHRLQRQGVKVILASGRAAASMMPYVRAVGTPCPFIACNGAQIVDAATGNVLVARELDVPLAREVLRWLKARGVYAHYYDGDDWFYDKPCQHAQDYSLASGVIGKQVEDMLVSLHHSTPKVLAIDTPERVRALIGEASEAFAGRLSVSTSKPYLLELTSPEATKGHAVATLAAMLGLSPETTVCAGDSLNDMSMLTWSRLPVTVENAREQVKAIAWRVAGDGRRDGLAALLDELIPEGEAC